MTLLSYFILKNADKSPQLILGGHWKDVVVPGQIIAEETVICKTEGLFQG